MFLSTKYTPIKLEIKTRGVIKKKEISKFPNKFFTHALMGNPNNSFAVKTNLLLVERVDQNWGLIKRRKSTVAKERSTAIRFFSKILLFFIK